MNYDIIDLKKDCIRSITNTYIIYVAHVIYKDNCKYLLVSILENTKVPRDVSSRGQELVEKY